MPLSEHVYCVAVTLKITEGTEQPICITFCVKFEHSSTEPIWMIQKVTAVGNWRLAAPTQASHPVQRFLAKHQITQVTQPSLQPRFGTLQLLAFPKTTITFEREEISDCRWDSGKYDRAADGDWENSVRSQSAYFEGDWGVIILCTMFLVSCIFFNKGLHFLYYMAGYLLDNSHIRMTIHDHTGFFSMN